MPNEFRAAGPRRVLPPRALAFSLVAQAVWITMFGPVTPEPAGLTIGAALIFAGALLNLLATGMFRRSDVGV